MFSELLLVFVTFIGLGFVGDYNIFLGVIVFSAVTYLCTRSYLNDSANVNKDAKSKSNLLLYYLNRYGFTVGNFVCQLICSVQWSLILIRIRKLLYVVRVVRNEEQDSELSSTQNHISLRESTPKSSQYCSPEQSVDFEIKIIVDCILREYIKSWYVQKISRNEQFISEVNCIVHDTLYAFCNSVSHIERKQFCCHIVEIYLHFFFHFKEALNKVCQDKNVLETCISKRKEMLENFKMHHWAMKDSMTEWFYLQSIMGTLIDSYGPVEFLSCPILHSVVVEILTRTVLYPLVNTVTDPDRLNSWILKLLQNVVKKENEASVYCTEKTNDVSLENTITETSTDLKNSEILLPKEESSEPLPEIRISTRSSSLSSELLNMSRSSSKLEAIPLEIGIEASPDFFKYVVSDVSPSSSQVLSDPMVQENNDTNQCLLFPNANGKAISNENLSNKSLNLLVSPKRNSGFLDVAHIKRSRSADYIRQMPHGVTLMPLNRSNRSIRLRGKDNKTFIQFKSDKPRSTNVEMAEEATEHELPVLFTDVKITDTQQQANVGHAPYTLYCVQYDGLFQGPSEDSNIPVLVKQPVNIKRRFREFLALQSRLDNNPALRNIIKGIKGPNKWQKIPFTNLDKKNVAERKLFLESYLQELCKHSELSKSSELQEFLAYGGDASIAFVKKPLENVAPRIDKITRSMKDLFRFALPGQSPEPVVAPESIPCTDHPVDETFGESDFQVYLVDFSKKESETVEQLENYMKNFDESSSSGSAYDTSTAPSNSSKRVLMHSLSINNSSSCSCVQTVSSQESSREENQLANVIVDFVIESFHRVPGPETSSQENLFKFLCGSIFERFVEEKLYGITEENCARLLHSFHKALWPEDKHHKKGSKVQNAHDVVTKLKEIIQQQDSSKRKWLLNLLLENILGSNRIFDALELIIGSIQNQALNRCFLFHAFDELVQALCFSDAQ